MLAIQPSNPQKCTPHLLPARINHNGPINDTSRYFKPETDDRGTQHVHFRGRHLHGTPIPLPATHTGAILHVTDKILPTQSHSNSQDDEQDEDEEDEVIEDVKIAEQIGSFDEIVVWEHGGAVDEERDGFVRGVREWVGWAGSMHVDDEEEVDAQKASEEKK
ncbi:hypothetical protein HBI81_143240 [Parastagonospora nodorum]|nr:hypothetical protein HBI10_176830 [Parastagonospora nodorum]KAH4017602.1 hypothetical protein HBI13_142360 [Parastagonospora nodorum]KAH6358270.1 hypothetical protein HBI34_210800 [Parastagonospora nodorum]KAH6522722.1 hypothetical protein HBI81_143240 [Parastagonospora nodorum]